jgi:hypothetical protein
LAVLALLLIGLSGCDQCAQETTRVTSPDGKVDAIVTVTNCGATTSYGYVVHVTARGAEPEEADERFRADKVHALKVYWEANRFLVIEYAAARIFHFSNFWSAKSVDDYKYVVQIRLK